MKVTVRTAIGFGLIWIIINMIVYLAGVSVPAFTSMILVNIFMLMASIAVGLFLHRKNNGFVKTIFLDDFKASMQGGIVYAVFIAAFIYVYHNNIDGTIIDSQVKKWMVRLHENVPNEEAYLEMQTKDETWQGKSYDDYIENQEDQIKSTLSPGSVFIAHLMGFVFFSFFFAFFATIIIRKIVLRNQDALN